jgi:hypothetical protein
MQIYQGKTVLSEKGDFAFFQQALGAAVVAKEETPFLLLRDDGIRLEIFAAEAGILLCIARGPNDCQVSHSSNWEGQTRIRLLSGESKILDDAHFADPVLAIHAIRAFFDRRKLSEHVDFIWGAPDPEITSFPGPMTAAAKVERAYVQLVVEVPDELRQNMRDVCEYLDEVANDRDVDIDFDDAIQMGALCGGRFNRRKDLYNFSYYLANDDVWNFRVPRTILDGIADGSIRELKVEASVVKR